MPRSMPDLPVSDPCLMTALAMIIGMVPMALGAGEGGEQNAPLGRAVIGGLMLATVATLIFVPAVFALFHGRAAWRQGRPEYRTKRYKGLDGRDARTDREPTVFESKKPPEVRNRGKRPIRVILLVVVGVAAILCLGIYFGIRGRTAAEAALAVDTEEAAVPIRRHRPTAGRTRPSKNWCCRGKPWPSPTRRFMPAPTAI